jgi:hypothetical protein
MNPPANAITWIKIEKPTFDLVGVVLGSFELTGFLLVAAVGLGVLLGLSLILRRRLAATTPLDAVSLKLAE